MNLFSAGTNFAPAVATGTGFFLGQSGNVFNVFSEDPLREYYAMRVPKDPSYNVPMTDPPRSFENSFRNLNFGRDIMSQFKTELVELRKEVILDRKVCHDEHCCSFSLDIRPILSNSTFQYRFVAFDGYRTYSGWGDKKLIICAIILCNNETLDSCGRMPNYDLTRVTFNAIEITTNFNRFGVLMMPNSLDLNMNPLSVDKFSYDEIVTFGETRKSTISLLSSHSDLQTFALYGHDYEVEEEFVFDGSG